MHTDLTNRKPRILLHACCGPCSTSCVERLAFDYDVTVFYYNPNITDQEEYLLRRDNLIKFIDAFNDEFKERTHVNYIEGEYKVEDFIKVAQPLCHEPEGGKRCDVLRVASEWIILQLQWPLALTRTTLLYLELVRVLAHLIISNFWMWTLRRKMVLVEALSFRRNTVYTDRNFAAVSTHEL